MIELVGGPLDGERLRMRTTETEIPYGYIAAEDLAAFEAERLLRERLGEPLPADAEPPTDWQGVYRWLEHIAPIDGPGRDRYIWRDGG